MVVLESKAVPHDLTREFFGLVLHLNGEQDSSTLMASIVSRPNCQELTYDGQKWAPTPTFLSGLSWLKAAQKWKSLEDQIMCTEASRNVSPIPL